MIGGLKEVRRKWPRMVITTMTRSMRSMRTLHMTITQEFRYEKCVASQDLACLSTGLVGSRRSLRRKISTLSIIYYIGHWSTRKSTSQTTRICQVCIICKPIHFNQQHSNLINFFIALDSSITQHFRNDCGEILA